jgi:hypothetical protein
MDKAQIISTERKFSAIAEALASNDEDAEDEINTQELAPCSDGWDDDSEDDSEDESGGTMPGLVPRHDGWDNICA